MPQPLEIKLIVNIKSNSFNVFMLLSLYKTGFHVFIICTIYLNC